MTYELTYDKYLLGYFPSEAAARRHAEYLPEGRYAIREWAEQDEFLIFDPETNKHYDFSNTEVEMPPPVIRNFPGWASGTGSASG